MKIGVFDSGRGGITVLHEAMKQLPEETFIFYADVDHVPYGTKSNAQVISYTTQAVQFLIDQEVKAVVIACNTATAVAIRSLRKKFTIPIIGIEPAVKPAIEYSNHRRVMVIATPITVREEKLHNLIEKIDDEHMVDLLALPKLVEFAEQGDFETAEVRDYLEQAFAPFHLENYSHLVLGCTHFGYFRKVLGEVFPETTQIIDGNSGTIRQLCRVLQKMHLEEKTDGGVTYYLSGREVTNKRLLKEYQQLHEYLDEINA